LRKEREREASHVRERENRYFSFFFILEPGVRGGKRERKREEAYMDIYICIYIYMHACVKETRGIHACIKREQAYKRERTGIHAYIYMYIYIYIHIKRKRERVIHVYIYTYTSYICMYQLQEERKAAYTSSLRPHTLVA
jgi:hypothetical protein